MTIKLEANADAKKLASYLVDREIPFRFSSDLSQRCAWVFHITNRRGASVVQYVNQGMKLKDSEFEVSFLER